MDRIFSIKLIKAQPIMKNIRYIAILGLIIIATINTSWSYGSNIIDAQSDKTDSVHQPSGVVVNDTDDRTIQNLEMLCRVWGFLKYYHPQVRDGKYDWDKELFGMIPKVINAKNNQELGKLFNQWVLEIGGTIEPVKMAKKTTLAWIDDKGKVGRELSESLNKIASAKERIIVSIPTQMTVLLMNVFRVGMIVVFSILEVISYIRKLRFRMMVIVCCCYLDSGTLSNTTIRTKSYWIKSGMRCCPIFYRKLSKQQIK